MEDPDEVSAAEVGAPGAAVAQGEQGLAQPSLERGEGKERVASSSTRDATGDPGWTAARGSTGTRDARRPRLDFL